MMDVVRVAVVDHTNLDDRDVERGVAALQQQVREDFGPVWGVEVELTVVPKRCVRERHPGHWGLILLDDEKKGDDYEDPVLGYHDLTRDGLPLARVFVNRVPQGQDWTHVASHELLEMLADPDTNATVYDHPDALTALFYAREVCDPVGAYENGYPRGGRHVSDFVFPTWFERGASARSSEAVRFDECRRTRAPFEILPGGYIGVFDPSISAWRVKGHDGELDEPRELGTRLERRSTAGNRWRTSDMIWSP